MFTMSDTSSHPLRIISAAQFLSSNSFLKALSGQPASGLRRLFICNLRSDFIHHSGASKHVMLVRREKAANWRGGKAVDILEVPKAHTSYVSQTSRPDPTQELSAETHCVSCF
ncbi:Uncharacterized protein HZ326_28608 [Fusarium oxysporum f. sp. albedinis]|nr:Uncharacterized protein HZ326_28608 [Fusarium oxysporum f. sp. albedinis]